MEIKPTNRFNMADANLENISDSRISMLISSIKNESMNIEEIKTELWQEYIEICSVDNSFKGELIGLTKEWLSNSLGDIEKSIKTICGKMGEFANILDNSADSNKKINEEAESLAGGNN